MTTDKSVVRISRDGEYVDVEVPEGEEPEAFYERVRALKCVLPTALDTVIGVYFWCLRRDLDVVEIGARGDLAARIQEHEERERQLRHTHWGLEEIYMPKLGSRQRKKQEEAS